MSKPKAGIIGGAGAMGSYMADIFDRHGYQILISDIDEGKATTLAADKGYYVTNSEDLARNSDIVMFSVPIPVTPEVIRKYGNLIKSNSLATDVTSRKTQAVKAMLESTNSEVEIVLMHPMFRPTVSPEGQRFIMIPVRPEKGGKWYSELENILYAEKATVKRMDSPEKHDLTMDILQGLAHTKHMVTVDTMMKLLTKYGMSLDELMEYSTAFYEKTLDLDGRIVAGNPDLYIPIQTESENMPKVLEAFMESLKDHTDKVTRKDSESLKTRFLEWKQFMGRYADDASKRTDRLIGKPIGIEIFYEVQIEGLLQELFKRKFESEVYKGFIKSAKLLSTGELAKISRPMAPVALAAWRFYKQRESKEGTVAFYCDNRRHPQYPDKGIRFSPIVPEDLERANQLDPHYKRVQLRNTYLDPILNLFDTLQRIEELYALGPWIGYRVQK